MTFKEFYNQRDSKPISLSLKPSTDIGSLNVVQDFSKAVPTNPVANHSVKPPMVVPKPAALVGRRKLSDRPIESKPTDFLARKSSNNVSR